MNQAFNISINSSADNVRDAGSLFDKLYYLGNLALYLLISLAVIYIVWNVVKFIRAEGDSRAEIRSSILWGIVGLAVILSIWGLVNILIQTFGIGNSSGGQLESQQDFQSLMLVK